MADEPEEVAESAPAEEPESQTPEVEESAPEPEAEESAPSKPETAAPEAARPVEEHRSIKAEKRIKQLSAKLEEMERRLAENSKSKEAAIPRPLKPKLESFETVEAFDKALDEWVSSEKSYESKSAVERDRQEREQKVLDEKRKADAAEFQKNWNKREVEARKRIPDFDTKTAMETVEVAPGSTMDFFLANSEIGPDVLHYLAQHDDEADKIKDLNPDKAYRALIKLEEQVSLQIKGIKQKPATKPPKYVSDQGSAPLSPKNDYDIIYGS
jgi:hypothetical protein